MTGAQRSRARVPPRPRPRRGCTRLPRRRRRLPPRLPIAPATPAPCPADRPLPLLSGGGGARPGVRRPSSYASVDRGPRPCDGVTLRVQSVTEPAREAPMARTARKGSTRAKRAERETAPEVRDPTHRPPANKGRTYPAEVLTPDEVRALVKACSG